MQIQTLLPPVIGEIFRFNVCGGVGVTSVEVCVGNDQVFKQEYEELLCRASTVIPQGTKGATLSIHAIDSAGNNKTLNYEISDSDPGPHSMLSMTG